MTINEKIKEILGHYGTEHQMMKAIEEMGELTTALARTACGRASDAQIKEETADIIRAKIDRTMDRIREEGR